jgi:hypothetical protein
MSVISKSMNPKCHVELGILGSMFEGFQSSWDAGSFWKGRARNQSRVVHSEVVFRTLSRWFGRFFWHDQDVSRV